MCTIKVNSQDYSISQTEHVIFWVQLFNLSSDDNVGCCSGPGVNGSNHSTFVVIDREFASGLYNKIVQLIEGKHRLIVFFHVQNVSWFWWTGQSALWLLTSCWLLINIVIIIARINGPSIEQNIKKLQIETTIWFLIFFLDTVEPWLSVLAGTRRNSLDNWRSRQLKRCILMKGKNWVFK